MSFITYSMGKLRQTKNAKFILFAFIEELVHHFWCITDETKVKYKALEIAKRIDDSYSLDLLKGWGLNGL